MAMKGKPAESSNDIVEMGNEILKKKELKDGKFS